jgi:hypothetical protein
MKYISIILAFFCLNISIAQIGIESNFNSVHTGRNINVLAKYAKNKISFNLGLKYNFNKENTFPQADIYKKSFWATSLGEHFGVETGFQFVFFQKTNVELFGFYQLQITKSDIKHDWFQPIGSLVANPQSETDLIYARSINIFGPVWGIENNFGIGLNTFFSKNLYLSLKLGGGILFVDNNSKNTVILGGSNWELSEVISIGLGFKFAKQGEP